MYLKNSFVKYKCTHLSHLYNIIIHIKKTFYNIKRLTIIYHFNYNVVIYKNIIIFYKNIINYANLLNTSANIPVVNIDIPNIIKNIKNMIEHINNEQKCDLAKFLKLIFVLSNENTINRINPTNGIENSIE